MKFWNKLKGGIISYNGTTYYGIWTRIVHTIVTAFPLLMVNGVAFAGQYAWAREKLPSWHVNGAAMFAIALESIALFVSYHAFLAEKRNDSALRLKLMSYGYGLFIGWINYSHWVTTNKTVALIVGMMSASSPFLWSVYSRAKSRPMLYSKGLIEQHALRLGATRWFYHPIRSWKLMYFSTWIGISEPRKAMTAYDDMIIEKRHQEKLEKLSTNGGNNGDNTNGNHKRHILSR
jgi:hypothetical protein